MRPRYSKPVPSSLRAALEADKAHALKHRRLSTERLAELMGTSPATLYKWLEQESMPAKALIAWQHLTGATNAVRYLASRESCVVIQIPAGKAPDSDDVHILQATLNGAVGALLDFMAGKADREACMGKLSTGLESLAWHRANVEKSDQPELEF